MKHVELIIDYLIDGDDFQYFDNTGIIVRCKDCKHNYNTCFNRGVNEPICDFTDRKLKERDFCSFGERRAEE